MADGKEKSADSASAEMIDRAVREGISTVFSRAESLKPCPIGVEESCCKICSMGPCRLPRSKTGETSRRAGVCGATVDTIVARNFARKVAGGSASHSDHAREVALTFLMAAQGKAQDFTIKDEMKLFEVALDFGINIEKRDVKEIAV